jgi:hypothetical protein
MPCLIKLGVEIIPAPGIHIEVNVADEKERSLQ